MFTFFLILFILVAGGLVVAMFLETGDQMPSACPRCGSPDQDVADRVPVIAYNRWYREAGSRFRCRHCHTHFKNHPNGTLVEDRD